MQIDNINITDSLGLVAGLLTTIAFSDGICTEQALEASIFMGGATVQWLRDGLGIIKTAREIEHFANMVEDTRSVGTFNTSTE